MRRAGWPIALLMGLAWACVGQPLGDLPGPGLSTRLVDPAEYPAYRQRAFRVPTWSTLGGRPQCVGGRYVPITLPFATNLLTEPPADDMVTGRPWLVGRVFRPDQGILRTPEPAFSDALAHMREAGVYLFNVGGYGPGSPLRGSFGQCLVTDQQNQALTSLLGDHWLGFDLGEQDGRYHNSFQALQLPSPRDAVGQHRAFLDWCDRVIDDQGGRLTLLSTLWGWHYPVRDGAMGLIGAECQNKFGVTNPQVQYAFLRGAGKQYGVLWYGDVSIFGTFGLTHWTLDDQGRLLAHPGGGSANLMRRMFLSEWLWNCAVLGFEGATVAQGQGQGQGRAARLSPNGIVQVEAERLIAKGFTPGVLQTPVAVLQDYFSGWMPARTNCTQFTAFNSLPYRPGDWLTDQLLSRLFPGYEDCGWYFDERGAMAPTPYGDIADCLLSDASAAVLARYSLVLVSGLEHDLVGVRDRLETYLAGGGTMLVVGDDAARLWPEVCRPDVVSLPAGSEVRWASGGAVDSEREAFDLHPANLPAGAEVLATCGDRPAVVRLARGKGTLVLLLAATGLNRTAQPAKPGGHPMWGGENTGLERPYRLLAHAARAYDAALLGQRLFTAGDGLTVTTCRRPDGTFVVGVSNPSLTSLPFRLTSHIGPIEAVHEVDLGQPIRDLPGYWPHRWSRFLLQPTQHRDDLGEMTGDATSDEAHVGGGDMRFFEVTLGACTASARAEVKLPAAPAGRRLRMPDLATLRGRLLAWPNFADHFDGVAIAAQDLLDTDPAWLAEQRAWYARHGLRVLADARELDGTASAEAGHRLALLCPTGELLIDDGRDAPPGVTVVRPAQVRVLAAGQVAPRGSGRIEVLCGDWRTWDGVYRDVRAAWLAPQPGRVAGPGPMPSPPAGLAKVGGPYLALHDLADPALAVAARPGLLDHCGGLMLDAAWLHARDRRALAGDGAWLAARRLGVVVDFTRSLNRFPDLTFAGGVPHRQAASQAVFEDCLTKMALLGCRQTVICSHANAETVNDWADQRAGIERFLSRAAELGIAVVWRTCAERPPGKLADHVALVADLRGTHTNLRIAACTLDEADVQRLGQALEPAGGAALWLLAAPSTAGRTGPRALPLATLPPASLAALSSLSPETTLVLDADYLSWDEALADVRILAGLPTGSRHEASIGRGT